MKKTSNDNLNIIIGKDICINDISINVKIKINKEKFKIYGYLGAAKVIWNYSVNIYPVIEGCSDITYRRLAKDYIVETLLQNNISVKEIMLSCKQYNKAGNKIIEIDRNNFIVVSFTGWIKGFVCGEEFVWDVNKYNKAIYVQGNNYRYCDLTDKITQWIINAGYKSINDLIYKLKVNKEGLSEDYYDNLEIIEYTDEVIEYDTNVEDIISKMNTEDIYISKHEDEVVEEVITDDENVNSISSMSLENFLK